MNLHMMFLIQELNRMFVYGILIYMHVKSEVLFDIVDHGNHLFIDIYIIYSIQGFHPVVKYIIVQLWLDRQLAVSYKLSWELLRICFVVYESTVVVPVFGIVEIIAHFKVGIANWIHIALVSSNIQVSRKASKVVQMIKSSFDFWTVIFSLWR